MKHTIGLERQEELLIPRAPRHAYGDTTAIDFATFRTTFGPTGELFNAEFAKCVYDAVWKTSTQGTNNPLTESTNLCLWLKTQMEALCVTETKKITDFINELHAQVCALEKALGRDINYQQFVLTLREIYNKIVVFAKLQNPEVSISVENNLTCSAQPSDNMGSSNSHSSYCATTLRNVVPNLFPTANFKRSVYEKLIIASQKNRLAVIPYLHFFL